MDILLAMVARFGINLFGAITSPRLSILIFHRVHAKTDRIFPNEPDAPRFERLMRLVASTFRVMTLSEAVTYLTQGNLPARALVITFDDGYADNAEVALPILQRFGLTASFFVATGFLDGGRMWNDSIIECLRACRHQEINLEFFGLGCYAVASDMERRGVIEALLPRIKYLSLTQREESIARLQQACGVTALPKNLMMRSAQVRVMHKAGMEIGAHTVHHPILTKLSPSEAEFEISEGRNQLESILDAPVDFFAYPNGKPGQDYDQTHSSLVKALGFRGAVTTAPGVGSPGDDLFQLPRFTPWNNSLPAWTSRLLLNQRNIRFERAAPTP